MASESLLQSAARAADRVEPGVNANVVKGALAGTSLTALLLGLRSAWKHSRQPEAQDLVRAQVLGGVGFATRALAVATGITISGFALAIVSVSWALNVNTPSQFGSAMKQLFGDSLRLEQSKNITTSSDFEQLLLSATAAKEAPPTPSVEEKKQ